MCSAVRTDSRTLLRSSSIRKPSDPPSRVMFLKIFFSCTSQKRECNHSHTYKHPYCSVVLVESTQSRARREQPSTPRTVVPARHHPRSRTLLLAGGRNTLTTAQRYPPASHSLATSRDSVRFASSSTRNHSLRLGFVSSLNKTVPPLQTRFRLLSEATIKHLTLSRLGSDQLSEANATSDSVLFALSSRQSLLFRLGFVCSLKQPFLLSRLFFHRFLRDVHSPSQSKRL